MIELGGLQCDRIIRLMFQPAVNILRYRSFILPDIDNAVYKPAPADCCKAHLINVHIDWWIPRLCIVLLISRHTRVSTFRSFCLVLSCVKTSCPCSLGAGRLFKDFANCLVRNKHLLFIFIMVFIGAPCSCCRLKNCYRFIEGKLRNGDFYIKKEENAALYFYPFEFRHTVFLLNMSVLQHSWDSRDIWRVKCFDVMKCKRIGYNV